MMGAVLRCRLYTRTSYVLKTQPMGQIWLQSFIILPAVLPVDVQLTLRAACSMHWPHPGTHGMQHAKPVQRHALRIARAPDRLCMLGLGLIRIGPSDRAPDSACRASPTQAHLRQSHVLD